MNEVKRYAIISDDWDYVESPSGGFVDHGDYIARCQRLADELAITRRVIDRIGQLCTTPHESKERFIRRVQSVIEWEAQALSDEGGG